MNQLALQATAYLDHEHPSVKAFALEHSKGLQDDKSKSIRLFEVVRDKFAYDPYNIDLRPEALRASKILQRSSAYCIEKAIVLAACLRALGIPARLHFGNVRNHIGTDKLREILKTDVMAFHGCTEIYLKGRWLKATPAFNTTLCEKLGVETIQFNGEEDAVFQEYSNDGRLFMEYVKVHGSFDDMPFELFVDELKSLYEHLFKDGTFHYKL